MTGTVQINPGQTAQLTALQMYELKLPDWDPTSEQEGYSTSELPEYAGEHFTWLTTVEYIRPEDPLDDCVKTFKKTNYVYHLTRHHKYPLPTLDTPVDMGSQQIMSLYIQDGRASRPDLKDYSFTTTYHSPTGKCEAKYTVIMTRI